MKKILLSIVLLSISNISFAQTAQQLNDINASSFIQLPKEPVDNTETTKEREARVFKYKKDFQSCLEKKGINPNDKRIKEASNDCKKNIRVEHSKKNLEYSTTIDSPGGLQ